MRRARPFLPDRCRRSLRVVAAAVSLVLIVPMARAIDPVPTPAPSASPGPADAAPGATPHPSSDAVKKELSDTIEAQLAAFRANDYTKAYTFAAAEIKGIFAAEDFEKMVRTTYPVIAHSSAADYGIAFDTGEEAVVNVRISGAENRSAEYQYLLKKEDGHWKISGVSEIKPQGLSV